MELDESYSPESLLSLSEDARAKKLSKLNEQEQVAVVHATAVEQITKYWCEEALLNTKLAIASGDVITAQDKPDVIKMYGRAMSYITLLENTASELVRDELLTQDEGSQVLTENANQFITEVMQIKQKLMDSSIQMEEWLARRLIRRELRLNINADGDVTPISSYEDESIEPSYLVNKEGGQTNE